VSEKALKQLVGALAVVLLIWLVSAVVGRGSGSGSIRASGEIAGFFEGVEGPVLDEIRMGRPGETVTLRRDGDDWLAGGLAADTSAVARFLLSLSEARVGELAATNPANHDRMGVSVDSAYALTLVSASGERTLLVGRSGRRFATAYVRLPEADEVYLLEGDVRAQLSRDLDAWRDRAIVAVDTAAVRTITVTRGAGGYTLVRGDSAWTFEGGGELAASAVTGILSELSGMMASGFLEETDSLASAPEGARVQAFDGAGALLAEVRFGEGEGDRWARGSANEYLYRVTNFRLMRAAPERMAVEPDS
jgi:hypothetical protein